MAEIQAKLGLDDSKFERGLQGVSRKATGILGMLQRKFSATDIFKGVFRSVGMGIGVGAISEKVVNVFRRGAEEAGSMADHTQRMLDIQRNLEGAMRGPRREIELQVKQFNELNRDIEDQKRLIESLNNPVLEFISSDYQQQVDQANAKLKEMVEKQASLGASAKIAANADKLRTEALQRQQVHANNLANIELRNGVEGMKFAERKRALQEEYAALQKQGALPSDLQQNLNRQKALENEQALFQKNQKEQREDIVRTARLDGELSAAELRDAGEVEKKQLRLNALRREGETIRARRGVTSNEFLANRNQQAALGAEIAIDQRNAGSARRSTLAELGSSLSTGRAIAPRSRGRSERERIADRGESYRMQAEDAVRTGKTPEYVARLSKLATRDTLAAGKAAERTMKQIDKTDPAVGQLIRIHKALEEINKNLAPTETEK